MFEIIFFNLIYINEDSYNGYFPLPISFSSLYQIRCEVILGKYLKEKNPHVDGKIKILDGSSKPNPKIIFECQTSDKFVDSFIYNPLNKSNEGVSALLSYDFANVDLPFILLIEIFEIKMKFIDSLNTSKKNKNEILQINIRYLLKNYKDALIRIGTLGEAIAKELMRKLKIPWKDFRGAINALVHKDITRSRINYQYLGHLLSPLYYIRNQTHHSEPKIEINETVAEFAIKNLTLILEHIYDKNIRF